MEITATLVSISIPFSAFCYIALFRSSCYSSIPLTLHFAVWRSPYGESCLFLLMQASLQRMKRQLSPHFRTGLAYSRQQLSARLWEEGLGSDFCHAYYLAWVFFCNRSDDRCILRVWTLVKCLYDLFCLFCRSNDHHCSFAGKIKWFKSKHSTDSLHFGSYRDFCCINLYSNLALSCNLV